jgi:hypothetical protein
MNWLGIVLMLAAFGPLLCAILRLLERARSGESCAWCPGYLDLLSAGLFSAGIMILPERTAIPEIQTRLIPLALAVWAGMSGVTLALLALGRFCASTLLARAHNLTRTATADSQSDETPGSESR